jgi:carboxynorspermidine decarboxylase
MPVDFTNIPSPCYVLDEQLLEKNLRLIANVKEQAEVDIILAFKGFAMWSAFPQIKKMIGSTTASSLNEAKLAFEEFGAPTHTYSPAYIEQEFAEIIGCSSHITFNSLTQFHHLLPVVKTSGKKVSLGIRVNPEF